MLLVKQHLKTHVKKKKKKKKGKEESGKLVKSIIFPKQLLIPDLYKLSTVSPLSQDYDESAIKLKD